MPIYTKRGDRGKTGFFGKKEKGKKVSKDSRRVHTLGSIDELNSYLGIVISQSEDKWLNNIISDIQKDLLIIGSIIGGSNLSFSENKTTKLEKTIDNLENTLPPLKNFILPGGSKIAAHLQYARSLARKAERMAVSLDRKERIKPQILTFLNRLSDFLFTLARGANYKIGVKEEVWKGEKNN